MQGPYQLKDGVYLCTTFGITTTVGLEVGLCFDQDGWVLHGHGKPGDVQQRFERMKKAYRDSGMAWFVKDLGMWIGKPAVEELNRVVTCSGYVKNFMQQEMLN